MMQRNVLNTSFFLVVRIFLPVLLGVRSVHYITLITYETLHPKPYLPVSSSKLYSGKRGAKGPRGIVIVCL